MADSVLPCEEFHFKALGLEAVREALQKNLKSFFAEVEVEVVDCPDLSSAPFDLATKGFGGGETGIIDLGGVPYLVPAVDRSKIYDFSKILPKYIGSTTDDFSNGFYISGAGAGPWPSQSCNCEMVTNMFLNKDGKLVKNKSRVILTSPNSKDEVIVRQLDESESTCALMANLLVSSGIPGKVLRLKCSKRTDTTNNNLTESIRAALSKEFGTEPVGLAGIFLIQNSKSKIHVMPDFSKTPLQSDQEVDNWLQFYHMDPPMLFQSILVSHDPGLDLRIEHSHGWSLDGKNGGHYHYDLSPDTVEYVAYYAVAHKLWRIDRPVTTHQIGRD